MLRSLCETIYLARHGSWFFRYCCSVYQFPLLFLWFFHFSIFFLYFSQFFFTVIRTQSKTLALTLWEGAGGRSKSEKNRQVELGPNEVYFFTEPKGHFSAVSKRRLATHCSRSETLNGLRLYFGWFSREKLKLCNFRAAKFALSAWLPAHGEFRKQIQCRMSSTTELQ